MQRQDDVTVFKMAAVRHLGFLKFNFLTVGAIKRPTFFISVTNFVKIGQPVAEIFAIFLLFKMAATAVLDFQKFEILTVDPL